MNITTEVDEIWLASPLKIVFSNVLAWKGEGKKNLTHHLGWRYYSDTHPSKDCKVYMVIILLSNGLLNRLPTSFGWTEISFGLPPTGLRFPDLVVYIKLPPPFWLRYQSNYEWIIKLHANAISQRGQDWHFWYYNTAMEKRRSNWSGSGIFMI